MYINRVGWRTSEPDDEPPERSTWTEAYAHRAAAEGLIARETLAEYLPSVSSERFSGDMDRRALMKLPLEERHAVMRAQAEAVAARYNREIDAEWLDSGLGEWDGTDE
jgi:hypothetical protein